MINKAWEDRSLLENDEVKDAVLEVISLLDEGRIRVAEPMDDGWKVNEWIRKAVILYFPIQKCKIIESGPFEYYDKIELKKSYNKLDVRVVPPAVARRGSYIAPGVLLMPCYVNIGAYIDSGTICDTWVTVGSCAQIGNHVHLGSSVNIGGVLKPLQSLPVIIDDYCFIGSGCNIVEGVHIEREVIIASNTSISKSTRIIDVSGLEPMEYKGFIPPYSVVIQGSITNNFPAGEYNVPVALIIGKRKASTDKKASLKEALLKYEIII